MLKGGLYDATRRVGDSGRCVLKPCTVRVDRCFIRVEVPDSDGGPIAPLAMDIAVCDGQQAVARLEALHEGDCR